MPLLKFDLVEGRDQQAIKALLDAAHRAVAKALGVPARDRFQIVYQHPAHELIIQDTGLGIERTDNIVVISITSTYRTEEQKQKLYKALADELQRDCGIDPQDIMINLVNNSLADWSIGCVFELIMSGEIVAEKIRTYPLRDVAKAHSDLETGKTTGSLILVPSTK
jgi:phenylpyruvate tautomerase PptA (4-oxalocrotonate tautomerase family)